jgi:VanZ family protein
MPSKTFKTIPTFFENEDKVIHFLMYGGMSAMLCWAIPRRNRRQFAYYAAITCFCAGYGMLMEILQGVFTQLDRSFSWFDMTANLAGAIFFIPIKEKLLPRELDKTEQ